MISRREHRSTPSCSTLTSADPFPPSPSPPTDPSQVLTEISKCSKANPNSYVRLAAFDNVRQVQIASFLVQRPAGAKDYCPVDKRALA